MKKKLVTALAVLLTIGFATAAILTYYGLIEVTLDVNQPVEVTGELSQNIECDAGQTCIGGAVTVSNEGEEDRTITLDETIITSLGETDEEGIEVNYVGYLLLENKNPADWTIIEDDRYADFYYFIVGDEFGYRLEAQGLEISEEYSLIYYLDSGPTDPDSGKPWNLDNAVLIATGVSDSNGELVVSGREDTGNLPFPEDYNANPDEGDSYCNGENGFDYYEHCFGAKIWLITGELELSNWNPTEWLFETDLIHYYADSEYVVPAGSYVEFYPLFSLDPLLKEGQYQMNITVLPA